MTPTPAMIFMARANDVRVDPQEAELPTTETSLTWSFDATAKLAVEGDGVTIESAAAKVIDSTEVVAPAVIGSPDMTSSSVLVTLDGSTLTVGVGYRLVVTYTSSAGNTESMELDVRVPF